MTGSPSARPEVENAGAYRPGVVALPSGLGGGEPRRGRPCGERTSTALVQGPPTVLVAGERNGQPRWAHNPEIAGSTPAPATSPFFSPTPCNTRRNGFGLRRNAAERRGCDERAAAVQSCAASRGPTCARRAPGGRRSGAVYILGAIAIWSGVGYAWFVVWRFLH